jgi:hypothetical protein
MSGGAVAGPVEGVPGWHVPTTFPHITNFVSNPLAALLLSADLPLSVPLFPLSALGSPSSSVTQVCLSTLCCAVPHTQKPELRSRNRRGSILRSMSKHMEVRVTVVGLSGAGKSTLVEQLAQQDGSHTFISTTPTTPDEGRMELHEPSDTMRMMIWDMNGRPEARRATWSDQIERCDAVMYVIDCGDLESFDGARCHLWLKPACTPLLPPACCLLLLQ